MYPFQFQDREGGPQEIRLGNFQHCIMAKERLLLHRHNHFEIFWMKKGAGTQITDFRSYPIKAGALFFISPGQVHAWEAAPGTEGSIVSFTRDFFLSSPEGQSLLFGLPFFFPAECAPTLLLRGPERGRFGALFARLEAEFESALTSRKEMMRIYLQMLLIEAQRAYEGQRETGESARAPAPALLTRRFLLLVEERFAAAMEPGAYARLLSVSAGHLRDTVKEETGRAVGDWVQERRLLEARRLLAHTELTVAEIAYQIRFDDPSYFGRFFRKQEGVSPGSFRAQFRERS
ncbi:MAG: helix-turn-helix domain-containing protein [Chthoniobacterales bacterium]|nr:helix-turn-helix domain-containing protein [Chthoniobacterales bacterium]